MAEHTGREDAALVHRLALLPEDGRRRAIAKLTAPQLREFFERWPIWAHGGQREPDGEPHVWLILAGRGFGKTRAGAEWLSGLARRMPDGRFALVGATIEDVRRVMIEGPAGLIAIARTGEDLLWRRERGEVEFASGAIAYVYSAEAGEALRGPEHDAAWCDEIGKWGRRGEATWHNMMMGLRRGDRPRVVVTTTPKPSKLVKRVERLAGEAVTRGRTTDNPHLPANFIEAMVAEYAGTRLGRQELDGELIEDVAGALWTRARLEGCRTLPDTGRGTAARSGVVEGAPPASNAPEETPLHHASRGPPPRAGEEWARVVIGVDPPAGSTDEGGDRLGDACGIVAVALGHDGRAVVLEDASVRVSSPHAWAVAVADCAERWGADRVVAEANNGGQMVAHVLRSADVALPIKLVTASRGKVARAEPVAALYEGGKVSHAGAFPELEDELCGLVAGGGYEGPGRSPDRADALVWALSELMLGKKRAAARVLGL